MGRLTPEQQQERFGMSLAEARALRSRVEAALTPETLAAARAAWQALAYELRGNRGGPFLCEAHPEAVRFHMLRALDRGDTVEQAVEAARAFANPTA